MGIFFTMYSQITSILNFNWAEIGTIGAPSAIVPIENTKSDLQKTKDRERVVLSSVNKKEKRRKRKLKRLPLMNFKIC